MITLTKEWLQKTIAELEEERDATPGAVNEDAANALAAMKLALASLEAEPVAWLLSGGGAKNNVSFDSGNAYADPLREVTPLYTAPPAPVSVPDGYRLQPISEYDAMCAAMLQAEPVSNSDELPLDYLQGHKDGLEWAAQLAKANHPQTGDWLYYDPIELARAIRKGPDMPTAQAGNHTEQHLDMVDHSGDANKMVAGNSPVIPNGYVLVPKEITCAMDDAAWEAYHETRCMSDIWAALLAAAPQQEVKP